VRTEAALADRRHEVRLAARGWRRAGAVDDATLASIESAYPDDRSRLGPAFRAVAFVLGLLALNAFFGVIAIASGSSGGFGAACLVFSLLLIAATETLVGPLRRADSGLETATALLSVVYAVVALGFLLAKSLPESALIGVLLAAAAVLGALGSARWGSPLLAFVAGVCAFVFLARLPSGRLLWLLAAAVAVPLLLRASESAGLPPAHRSSCRLGVVMALCASYVAVHLGSLDFGWLEWLAEFRDKGIAGAAWVRPLSILATALVPVAVLGFGVATRRVYLVSLGILLGVASLVTLRFYVHVAPAWMVLVASGAAALGVTLGVRRLLAAGPGAERGGFTAEPLFGDPKRRHAAEVVGTVAAFAPPAAAVPGGGTSRPGPLEPGGGAFGGGGATSDF
jgi:hypothetical protein